MATTFHNFSMLPPELRNAIWTQASYHPRVVNIEIRSFGSWTHEKLLLRSSNRVHTILNVSQEARREALRVLKTIECSPNLQDNVGMIGSAVCFYASDIVRILFKSWAPGEKVAWVAIPKILKHTGLSGINIKEVIITSSHPFGHNDILSSHGIPAIFMSDGVLTDVAFCLINYPSLQKLTADFGTNRVPDGFFSQSLSLPYALCDKLHSLGWALSNERRAAVHNRIVERLSHMDYNYINTESDPSSPGICKLLLEWPEARST